MSKIKPINLDSDTFSQLKTDMTQALNRLLRTMQSGVGADSASLTVKLNVELKDETTDDGSAVTVPVFEHTVTSNVQVKNKVDGKLNGYYSLVDDGRGNYSLKPLNDQIDMFEEAVE